MIKLNDIFLQSLLEQFEVVPVTDVRRIKNVEGISNFVAKMSGMVYTPSFRTYAAQVGKFNVDLSEYDHQNPIYRLKIHDSSRNLVYANHINEGDSFFQLVASAFKMVDCKYSEAEKVRMEESRSKMLKKITSRARQN